MTLVDLHFHSKHSDGLRSVPELVSWIVESELQYCALTDHDTVSGLSEMQHLLEPTATTFIPGVEITVLHEASELHLLTYDFDIQKMHAVLEERRRIVSNQKLEEMGYAKGYFAKEGIYVDDDLVPEEKKPVGYTVATHICRQERNQKLFLKKFGKKLHRDDIYNLYQAPGKTCATTRSGVTSTWVLESLHGIASDFIIAHPFVSPSIVMKPISERQIIELIAMGVTGLEVYHDHTTDKQIHWLEGLVEERGLHYTGGSDFHGNRNDLSLGYYNTGKKVPGFHLTNFQQ